MSKKQLLDRFGEVLMKEVRDSAISDWENMLDGKAKGKYISQFCDKYLSGSDAKTMDTIRAVLPGIVDTTLHFLLFMLEEKREIVVSIAGEDESVPNIREVSDGLPS